MAKITLAALVLATASTQGFMYATVKDAKKLVEAGEAEMNTTVPNPANVAEFPIRATEAGIAKHNAAVAAASAPVPQFAFITSPALVRPSRGGGRKNKYPFADFPAPLNGVTTKIFVPSTAEMPNPAKSLSSTVSAASREFAHVVSQKPGKDRSGKDIMKNVYEFDRKFAIVPGEHDGVKGAFIERVK